MYPLKYTLVCLAAFQIFISTCNSQLSPDDIYTFCGKGRPTGDSAACHGFCSQTGSSICSAETGICSCSSPARSSAINTHYDCKPARPRTRCHNACKTYTMLTPRFRRGEVKVCQSKTDSRKMCFCLPKS